MLSHLGLLIPGCAGVAYAHIMIMRAILFCAHAAACTFLRSGPAGREGGGRGGGRETLAGLAAIAIAAAAAAAAPITSILLHEQQLMHDGQRRRRRRAGGRAGAPHLVAPLAGELRGVAGLDTVG